MSLFTPEQTRIVEDIRSLKNIASDLVRQKNELKKKDTVVRQSYDLAICDLLGSIRRLSEKLPVEKVDEKEDKV